MVDIFTKEKRSSIMSQIKGQNTKPEVTIRKLLHRMGYRFRLHRKDLPGKPDIVLPRYKKVIFVHGCFWHSHPGCKRSARPVSNSEFWDAKIGKNVQRDLIAMQKLRAIGWEPMIIWQCEIADLSEIEARLRNFLIK